MMITKRNALRFRIFISIQQMGARLVLAAGRSRHFSRQGINFEIVETYNLCSSCRLISSYIIRDIFSTASESALICCKHSSGVFSPVLNW